MDSISEEVVSFIQDYCRSNVFRITHSAKKHKKHDEWQDQWLKQLGNISEVQRSMQTVRKIQAAVQQRFGAVNVFIEEPIQNVMNKRSASHLFDIFLPGARTAIEICLSAIKNEFEKDILKAMLDGRTATLYILMRDYVTGRNETHYGVDYLQAAGPKSIIDLVKIYKLAVKPV